MTFRGPHHVTSLSLAIGSRGCPRCQDTLSRETLRSPPDRLLHLLHIRSVDRRGIQPSYCFRGATATRRQRPTSLQLVLGQRALTARSSSCLHMGIRYRYLILTHCSCRHFFTCWHQGAEKPSLTSHTRPFFVYRSLGSNRKTFSRKGYVTPPARVRKLPPSPCLRAPIGDHHPMICG